MIAHSNLAANDTVIFNNSTSGYTGLSSDNDAFTDVNVMGDLNEIVDLCPRSDPRLA